MSEFKGFGEIKSPNDLVQKLEHDFVRIKSTPQDQYAAFDFFVTAEHIVDWIYPTNRVKRDELRSGLALLRITSHIANGAKHFEATAKHHHSVTDVEKSRYAVRGYMEDRYSEDLLLIHLTLDEQKLLGVATIEAVTLAQQVLKYWRTNVPKA